MFARGDVDGCDVSGRANGRSPEHEATELAAAFGGHRQLPLPSDGRASTRGGAVRRVVPVEGGEEVVEGLTIHRVGFL